MTVLVPGTWYVSGQAQILMKMQTLTFEKRRTSLRLRYHSFWAALVDLANAFRDFPLCYTGVGLNGIRLNLGKEQ